MIVYDLKCPNGHVFEGWFEDRDAFEKQLKKNLIACPICNDTGVNRIPSTFAIKGTPMRHPEQNAKLDADVLAKAFVSYMEKNFDNVGSDFAKEALKIHYGVSEPRNIRGFSTSQEEETLRQEGVSFFKLPVPETPTPSSETEQ